MNCNEELSLPGVTSVPNISRHAALDSDLPVWIGPQVRRRHRGLVPTLRRSPASFSRPQAAYRHSDTVAARTS